MELLSSEPDLVLLVLMHLRLACLWPDMLRSPIWRHLLLLRAGSRQHLLSLSLLDLPVHLRLRQGLLRLLTLVSVLERWSTLI
jgi:hypothetical protein